MPSGPRTKRWRWKSTIGAAFGGARALCTMKHVGLNVASDPLFTAAYTGVSGALVVVSADDPGMASSQNEQDNRRYAVAAGLPMLEPSDSQEAYDFFWAAIEMSERWKIPVLLPRYHARLPQLHRRAAAREQRRAQAGELRAGHPRARDDPGLRPARPPAPARRSWPKCRSGTRPAL